MTDQNNYFPELDEITHYYGDRKAHRSGVPLINHIHEGINVIEAVLYKHQELANLLVRAYCLHPLVQEGVDKKYWKHPLSAFSKETLFFAKIYRIAANSYLCTPENDHIQNATDLMHHFKNNKITFGYETGIMLYADKIQNRKDFALYHEGTHPRSQELKKYFNVWLEYLHFRIFKEKELQ